jgi:hypothetical protein
MINRILTALKDELNEFVKLKDPINFGLSDIVVLSNLVEQDGTLAFTTNNANQTEHKIVITLINIEEEKVFKEQQYFKKTAEDKIVTLNPELKIHLHVLFTAYSTSYETALLILGYVLSFFQKKSVFTNQNTPSLNGLTAKATVELQSLSSEQNNHLWGYLGAKYMPSMVYKIKMLIFQEAQQTSEGLPITIINEFLQDKTV